MSLARDLIDAALAADLSQNELRVFLALFRQTLGYGKASDPLTLKRLAALSHIRKDRLTPALNKILQVGLFTATPHEVFEHEYAIPADFLTKYPQGFYTPALPKKRNSTQQTEAISEKQTHTENNLNRIQETSTTAKQVSSSAENLPYPPSFTTLQCQAAARILDGLTPEQARDCVLLLAKTLKAKPIQSPLGYLHHLAKIARQGWLDTSQLTANDAPLKRLQQERQQRLHYLQAEIRGLDALFTYAGTAMDSASAARRAAWMQEYQQLVAT